MRKTSHAIIGLLLLSGPLAPVAADAPALSFEAVSDTELAEQRGGFNWGGVDVSFGAEMRTFLDGNLALLTTVHWPDSASSASPIVVQSAAGALDGANAHAGPTVIVSPALGDVYLANGGQTAILHRVDGAFQNILINSANGLSARQEIDATLSLTGYAPFRDATISNQMLSQIGLAIGQAAKGF